MSIKTITINKNGLSEMENPLVVKDLSNEGDDLSISDESELGKQKTLKPNTAYMDEDGEISYHDCVDFGEISNYWD